MTWPWTKWRREAERQRAAERQAFLDALKAVTTVVTSQAGAMEKVAEVLLAELQLYKIEGKPTARAHNDLTETILELERAAELRDQGFPVDSPLAEQYRYVLSASDHV